MKVMRVRLPVRLVAKIERLARDQGRSVSAVVSNALRIHLGHPRPSFSEAAAEFCGAAKGPGDLSTKRRYGEDFGT